MCEVMYAKAGSMFPVIKELLDQGIRVRITVTGMSMYPFLIGNRDMVELIQTNMVGIRRGDIVLIQRDNGAYVLHRVFANKKDGFYIVGDAQQWIEGPFQQEHLIAKVYSVQRKAKYYKASDITWRLMGYCWLSFLPFRYAGLSLHHGIKKILRR